jgi:hypothetical protein
VSRFAAKQFSYAKRQMFIFRRHVNTFGKIKFPAYCCGWDLP